MKSFNDQIDHQRRFILVLLGCLCLISLGLAVWHYWENLNHEKKLYQQQLEQAAKEQAVIESVAALKEEIESLDIKQLTLEDQALVDDLQSRISNASQEEKKKIGVTPFKLRLAEIRLETLANRTGSIRQLWGNTFSAAEAAVLTHYLQECPMEVSVYVRMLDDGSVYIYQPTQAYYPASLAQTPYALYLSVLQEKGELSLNSIEREWMSNMIRHADNEATIILAGRYPAAGDTYVTFLDTLGFTDPSSSTITASLTINGEMNVVDAGHVMVALYDYFETGSIEASALKEDFLNTEADTFIQNVYLMAKKDGLARDANHSMAIIYAPRPYVLCMMTSGDDNLDDSPDSYGIMTTIYELVTDMIKS